PGRLCCAGPTVVTIVSLLVSLRVRVSLWTDRRPLVQVDVHQQGTDTRQQRGQGNAFARAGGQGPQAQYQGGQRQREHATAGVLPADRKHWDRGVDEELPSTYRVENGIPRGWTRCGGDGPGDDHRRSSWPHRERDERGGQDRGQAGSIGDGPPRQDHVSLLLLD